MVTALFHLFLLGKKHIVQLQLPIIFHPNDFPSADTALNDPDGLLAFGLTLTPELVYSAYQQGIFPWYSDDQPILWWSPSIRAVLKPQEIKKHRSIRKAYQQTPYTITMNEAFTETMVHCATIHRYGQKSTWITDEMIAVYSQLFHHKKAMSIEIWHEEQQVGGLYGILVANIFCGESMFSLRPNASKFALIALAQQLFHQNIDLIDCQMMTPHLQFMGAMEMTRADYLNELNNPSNLDNFDHSRQLISLKF